MTLRHLKPENTTKLLDLTGKTELVKSADISTIINSLSKTNDTLSSYKMDSFDISAIKHVPEHESDS